MKFTSNSVYLNYEYFNSFEKGKRTVIMIHGFTGSLEDWKDISQQLNESFNYIGIDLIGHGKSDSPVNESMYIQSSIIKSLDDLVSQLSINKVILLGYSMGGRAALSYAAEFPNNILGLILESTSPGIINKEVRNERVNADNELADFIEKRGIEQFVDLWMDKQIFNTQRRFSNEKLKKFREKRLLNSVTGLANSLRGFGTGRMSNISKQFGSIKSPVLLISGELDTKFTNINKQLKQKLKTAQHKIIQNSGHNTHLEETKKFIDAVNKFLNKI